MIISAAVRALGFGSTGGNLPVSYSSAMEPLGLHDKITILYDTVPSAPFDCQLQLWVLHTMKPCTIPDIRYMQWFVHFICST